LSETVAPFLDDLKRRVELGLEAEGLEIGKGLVLGFYRLDNEGGGELLQWAPEFTVDTAAYAVRSGGMAPVWNNPRGIGAVDGNDVYFHRISYSCIQS
jgi:hypothetical protein